MSLVFRLVMASSPSINGLKTYEHSSTLKQLAQEGKNWSFKLVRKLCTISDSVETINGTGLCTGSALV